MQKDRYGNSTSVEFFEDNTIPSMMDIPMYDHPGDPKGTDTVPAWLTPGEYVVNAEAVRMFEPQIEAMNEAGREVQRSQGGTIPSYEADGGPIYAEMGKYVPSPVPSWLTPEVLDSLMMVESGGNPKAVSPAGAQGLYQIMPATAANPGYNTQAITEADILDPVKSRMFAQQYLSGIQEQYPDYAPEQVLQAYNAGPGRMEAFLSGEGKPLAPETIAYANKVLSGVQQPEEQQVASSSWNPFSWLIGSAEAQSTVPTTQAPPLPIGSSGSGQVLPNAAAQADGLVGMLFENPVYADDMGEYIIGPEGGSIYLSEDQSQAVTRGASPPPVITPTPMQLEVEKEKAAVNEAARIEGLLNQGDYGVHDKIIRKGSVYNYDEESGNYIDKEGRVYTRDPLEFILDLPNVITSAQNKVRKPSLDQENDILIGKTSNGKDVYQDNENGRYYTIFGPDKNIKRALPRWQEDEIIFNDPNNRPIMPAPDSPYLDEDKSKLPLLPGTEELVPDAAVPPKPEESNVEDIIDAANTNSNTGSPPATNQFTTEQLDTLKANGLGVDENGNIIQLTPDDNITTKVKGYFTQMFSDLFSGPELARMAVMYAGSRALGYDHGGSISYAMKNYLERVDADVSARQEFVTSGDAIKRYTAKSLADYRKSGDMNDLIRIDSGMKKLSGNVYLRGIGKVQVFADEDGVEFVEYGGNTISVNKLKGLIEPWDEDIHGDKAVVSRFSDFAKEEIAVVNSDLGLSDDDAIKINSETIGNKANEAMRDIMRRNGVSINEAQPFYNAINGAISDYIRAKATAKKNGDTEPTSLEPFIELRSFEPLTGVSQSSISGTSVANLRELNTLIKREMNNQDPKTVGFNEEFKGDWFATYNTWAKLPANTRQEWINKAAKKEGWSGFTLWMSKTPEEEIVKILQKQ